MSDEASFETISILIRGALIIAPAGEMHAQSAPSLTASFTSLTFTRQTRAIILNVACILLIPERNADD